MLEFIENMFKKFDDAKEIEALKIEIDDLEHCRSLYIEENSKLRLSVRMWRNDYGALLAEYQKVNSKCASRKRHIRKLLDLLDHKTIKPHVKKINTAKAAKYKSKSKKTVNGKDTTIHEVAASG